MDAFCRSVESKSIGSIIPKYEKTINSYFDRLETSQIKRVEAFLKGESYQNKADGENEITKTNVDQVLFSQQKWDAILLNDTAAYYVAAYSASLEVVKEELGGFVTFQATDAQLIERARVLQLKVVGINERLRNNIRASIVNSVEAGGGQSEILESIRNVFKTSHDRANTIARTETGISMNAARYDAISAEVETKQWVSAKDSIVRKTHREYTKLKSVPMNYEYTNGLFYPQDTNCPEAGEIINCRCVLVAGKKK
jgi:uncharacterized protein with gpF-like domain